MTTKHPRDINAYINHRYFKSSQHTDELVHDIVAQFGGLEAFTSVIDIIPSLSDISNVKGFEDSDDLQSLYNKHKTPIVIALEKNERFAVSKGTLNYIHTKCPTATISDMTKGLNDLDIKYDTSDEVFLEGGRFLVRATAVNIAKRYKVFLRNIDDQDAVAEMIGNTVSIGKRGLVMEPEYMKSITALVGGCFDLLEHSEAIISYTEDADFERDVEVLQSHENVDKFFNENTENIMHFASLYAKVKYKNTVADLINRKIFNNKAASSDIYSYINASAAKRSDVTDEFLHNQFISRRYLIILGLASLCRAVSKMIND